MSSSTRSWRAEVGPASPGWRARRAIAAAAAVVFAGALPFAALSAVPTASVTPVPPDHVRRHIEDPQALGTGRLTWFGLHVYDAQLFVPRGFDPARPTTQPFALELLYARSLDGRAIAERSRDEIARLKIGTDAQRAHWLAEMTALFPDVKAGQRLAGIYRPAGATRFYVDGRFLGEIADPEFGRAFFAIWLDPRTSAPQLRANLLRHAH